MNVDQEVILYFFFKLMISIFGKAEIKRDMYSFYRYYLGVSNKIGAETIKMLYRNIFLERIEDFATGRK